MAPQGKAKFAELWTIERVKFLPEAKEKWKAEPSNWPNLRRACQTLNVAP
jgi:hypothetical protein